MGEPTCIGFAETEKLCTSAPSPERENGLCVKCDDARIRHIDKRMKELKAAFGL